jgi:hypothetical protein
MTILEFAKWLIDAHPDSASFILVCGVIMCGMFCCAIGRRK